MRTRRYTAWLLVKFVLIRIDLLLLTLASDTTEVNVQSLENGKASVLRVNDLAQNINEDYEFLTLSYEDNELLKIQKLPKYIRTLYVNVTVRYRCFRGCNIFLNVSTVDRNGIPLSHTSYHYSAHSTKIKLQKDVIDQNQSYTFRVMHSPFDIYYDAGRKAIPTNLYATHSKFTAELYVASIDNGEYMELVAADEAVIALLPPLERSLRPGYCHGWFVQVKRKLEDKIIRKCSNSGAVTVIIPSIVALSGNDAGFMRKIHDAAFPLETPPYLVKEIVNTARFTLSTWVYLTEYCQKDFCAVLSHRDPNTFLSPTILLNRYGTFHIQMHKEDGEGDAFLSSRLPLRKWINLILTVNNEKATIFISEGLPNLLYQVSAHKFRTPMFCNISAGSWNVGGFPASNGFKGFVGPTRLYKYRDFYLENMYNIQRDGTLIRKSGVHQLLSTCRKVSSAIENYLTFKRYESNSGCCNRRKWSHQFLHSSENQTACKHIPKASTELPKHLGEKAIKMVNYALRIVKRDSNLVPNMTQIANQFQQIAKKGIFSGRCNFTIWNFEVAGCLSASDAFYKAGALLTSGFFGIYKPLKAYKYQLIAAMQGNALAQMALGYKFQLGSSGLQQNCFLAAGYLKSAAVVSKYLIENEIAAVHTHSELIRLDEADSAVAFRGPKSDVVKWLSQQAERGSTEAQGKIAEILFHGHHGVDIDRHRALDFYRLGADQQDPMALYNLGVLYLRGLQVEKNETKAVELFKRSAAKNFSMALNSLGYVELVLSKNKTAASEYFQRAIKLNDRESMFHYGSLLESGYDKNPPNKSAALKLYRRSAALGQKAACFKVGEAFLLGELVSPDCTSTIKFFRYVAEQLSDIGSLLRQGLDSYLEGNWQNSLIGYLFAAEAGMAIGAFNMALLCEEYQETTQLFNGSCVTYFYNISAELGYSASLTAMGDRAWFGKGMNKDMKKSVVYYARAVEAGESPQALFSLGYMVENGYDVSGVRFSALGKDDIPNGNLSLAKSLYQLCMKSPHRGYEGYYPCHLADLILEIKIAFSDPWTVVVGAAFIPTLLGLWALACVAGNSIN